MTDHRTTTARGLRQCVALLAFLTLSGCNATPGPSAAATSPSVDAVSPSIAASPTIAPAVASAPAQAPSPSVFAPLGALPAGTFDATTVAAMQAILDAAVTSGAPDAIAAVITNRGAWAGAAGIGGPDGRKATVQDEFAIGSVGIAFVAALVIRLAERGMIDLDAPVDAYLGDLVFDTNGATVRQALGMRSGIPDIGEEVPAAIAADPAHHWTLEDTLAVLPDPSGPPGPYQPSPSNYVMLALAVEHVTGMPLAKAVRAEVLDPVGAARILVQGAGAPTPKPWALPTEAHLGGFKLTDLGAGDAISCIASATASHGVGGLASDAPSLAAWAWHLFAGDIVDGTSLTVMLPAADGHGLGLEGLEAPLDRAIGVTGGKTGYGTVLAIMPAEQTVAVVLVNDEEFPIDPYVVDLIKAATAS
jgi:CubicO group peptidase (beta-lactamase class C family)